MRETAHRTHAERPRSAISMPSPLRVLASEITMTRVVESTCVPEHVPEHGEVSVGDKKEG